MVQDLQEKEQAAKQARARAQPPDVQVRFSLQEREAARRATKAAQDRVEGATRDFTDAQEALERAKYELAEAECREKEAEKAHADLLQSTGDVVTMETAIVGAANALDPAVLENLGLDREAAGRFL